VGTLLSLDLHPLQKVGSNVTESAAIPMEFVAAPHEP
jgi:hypothetical protein